MEPVLDEFDEDNEQTDTDQENNEHTDTDRTDGDDTNTTPSQSRSSSVAGRPNQQIEEDSVDVFDGYSFKGRQSILLEDDDDDDEDESSEEETDEEEEEALALKGLALEPDTPTEASERPLSSSEIDLAEPKTPEARPTSLPSLPLDDALLTPLPESPELTSVDLPPEVAPEQLDEKPPPVPPADTKPRRSKDLAEEARPALAPKVPTKTANRLSRPARREKSGVPALDRYLSDAGDDGVITEQDDEDDDWDFVEAGDGEDRNGARGTTLFARGVVDRYKLAVFRKASTSISRTPSLSSKAASEASPTSSPEQRRGRNHLTFRRSPRQFLKPKNAPPSSYSSKASSITARSLSHSASARFSTMSSGSFLTTSPTTNGGAVSHSLKSKQSAVSVGGTSKSLSDQSDSLTTDVVSMSEAPRNPLPDGGKKTKKLKKYKEGAEKVFSLFAPTPRPQPQPHTS